MRTRARNAIRIGSALAQIARSWSVLLTHRYQGGHSNAA